MNRPEINLKLIIEHCRQGNRNSQRKLYEHFYGFGMHITLRYTRNREEALEILNDAFLKALLNLDKYDEEYPFQPWLRKVIVNTAIDYYRSRRGALAFVELSALEELPAEPFPYPELGPDEDVLPQLQQLPPAYRLVFNLYVMEGYKHQEIAEMLDITVSTSKSNLTRAKEKLRSLLLKKDRRGIKSS